MKRRNTGVKRVYDFVKKYYLSIPTAIKNLCRLLYVCTECVICQCALRWTTLMMKYKERTRIEKAFYTSCSFWVQGKSAIKFQEETASGEKPAIFVQKNEKLRFFSPFCTFSGPMQFDQPHDFSASWWHFFCNRNLQLSWKLLLFPPYEINATSPFLLGLVYTWRRISWRIFVDEEFIILISFFCESPFFVKFLDLLVCFRKFYIFKEKSRIKKKFFVEYLWNILWQILRHV